MSKKIINISNEAHHVAKMAAMVKKVKLNEYVSAVILENSPKYDLKPSKKA